MNPSNFRGVPFPFSRFPLRVTGGRDYGLPRFYLPFETANRIELKELEKCEKKEGGGRLPSEHETKSTTSIRSGRDAERSEAERFPTDRGRCFVGSSGAQRRAEPRSTSPSARGGSDVLPPLVWRFASGSRAETRVTKTSVSRPSAPRRRFAPLCAARRSLHDVGAGGLGCPIVTAEIFPADKGTRMKGALRRLVDGHDTLDVYERSGFHAAALSPALDGSARRLPRRKASTYPHCAFFRAHGAQGHHV